MRLTDAFQAEDPVPEICSYNIIINGQGVPVSIIKVVAMRLVCFSDVTEEFAKREGEGELSLEYWRREHKAFFTRAGFYSDNMELVAEEFEVVDVL